MSRALVLSLLATAVLAVPVKPKSSHSKQSTTGAGSATAASRSSKSASPHVVTTASKTTAHSASTAKTKHKKSRRGVHAAAAPSYQLHPDPERYQQIQQALADRGYFKGQVNGQWSDDSVDALKRFQADQKIDGDGKIDAHSLTSLGLGPKHDGSTAGAVPLSATSAETTPGSSPVPAVPPVSELPPETAPPETAPPQ